MSPEEVEAEVMHHDSKTHLAAENGGLSHGSHGQAVSILPAPQLIVVFFVTRFYESN